MDRSHFLFYASWLSLLASLGYAITFGGKPERIGIGIVALGSVTSMALVPDPGSSFSALELWMFGTDLAVLVAFVCLSLSSTRFWPLWVTSFQAITVFTHLAALFTPESLPAAYSILQGFWVYPMFVAILMGAYGHQKARRLADEWP
jgi:hypothetical protein